ncbi:FecR family protein [Kordia periserrulae]|uniref:FecR family protein n=1 Tax=Kordia periserrulae TaxID=701523 RepID=A0A2T6BTR2_9FLAO|nr:FecR domain-containing protein [Kordia periserrulae]PTX59453.1 FecR family protein [Kordia periserrulae]
MDNDNLIQKWLNGELSEAELRDFEQRDDFEYYQSIIENAQNFKASHFETVDDFETFKAKKLVAQTQKRSLTKVWMPLLKVAAVFIIFIGLYMFFMNDSLTTITTVASEKTNITLPDASEIVLNAKSSLSYDENNWNDDRTVNLLGEAYFKVAKGKTFDVIAQNDTIRVLGTQFNVKKRANYFEVTCYEGSVKVITKTHQNILAPGDQFVIVNNQLVERKSSDFKPNWTENISTFSAVPLQEVLAELERQFDVSIATENINSEQLFTGGFQHDDVEKALKAVTEPMNIRFEFDTEKRVILHENNQ